MISKELHMRYTSKDGKSHVVEHRVWDEALFVATRQAEQKALGGSAEVITAHEYRLMQ
ncbi:MAG: hypothetical protein WA045_00480 [Nitrospira sp.]